MADKRTTPEEAASVGPRKRAAPTIDLTATEVPPVADQETAPAGDPPGEPSSATSNSSRTSTGIKGSALAAGACGAAIITLVLLALWLTGLFPNRRDEPTIVSAAD